MIPELLTVPDVARALRTSPGAVRWLVYKKRIPFVKLNGRLLFESQVIERWIVLCRDSSCDRLVGEVEDS